MENQLETNINNESFISDHFTNNEKVLSEEERARLRAQDTRLVPAHKAQQLEQQAQRHWDLFYKRNETRFFKDRRWTKREFQELIAEATNGRAASTQRKLLEVGCGVGNLIFPLIEDENAETPQRQMTGFFYYACDFSPRAVEFVKANPLYDERRVRAFQCDITTRQCHDQVPANSLDIVTLIFVLSAIHPEKFKQVLENLWLMLKPNAGVVLFRDYGVYDMAQLRFKPGHKIAENFYMRQDGTRSYYFAEAEVRRLFEEAGFEVLEIAYVHRRTLNVKEKINVPRIFLQGKFRKLERGHV